MNERQIFHQSPVTETQAHLEQQSKPHTSDWPLLDVLECSPESKTESGTVTAYTAEPHVKDGELTVNFSDTGCNISFITETPDFFKQTIEEANREGATFVSRIDRQSIELADLETAISIIPAEASETSATIQITGNQFSRTWLPHTLKSLQLQDLLRDNTIPEHLTEEYAQELIDQGVLQIGKREIPVALATDTDHIKDCVDQTAEDQRSVYHGTSLTIALSIAQSGLFSEKPNFTRPILSAQPDNIAATLAENKWSGYPRTDSSGFGAIIQFSVRPEQLISHGIIANAGRSEEIFQPAEQLFDENERYRLQRNIKAGRFSATDPGYIPPQNISKIILIKQQNQDQGHKS